MVDLNRDHYGLRFFTSEFRALGWGLLVVGCLVGAAGLAVAHLVPLLVIPLAGVVYSGYKYREASRDYWGPTLRPFRRLPVDPKLIQPSDVSQSYSFSKDNLSAPGTETKWRERYGTEFIQEKSRN